jgi:hypothetical protein
MNSSIGFGRFLHSECDGLIQYQVLTSPEQLWLIRNWKFNRPPDPIRISEIENYIRETGLCDGELLLAFLPGEGYLCYDGIHRLMACQSVFPREGVRVRILMKASDEIIRREFLRINKGVPVPELYFSTEEIDRHILQLLMKSLQEFTKLEGIQQHLSPSRRPRRPNFNRDCFLEELTSYCKEHYTHECMTGIITQEMILEWLQDINIYIRENDIMTIPETERYTHFGKQVYEKCVSTGWFLWIVPLHHLKFLFEKYPKLIDNHS